ncbi:hypothetical protein FA13DRAFT_1720648 [Coprinellus micaceus]|uniref:Uncharacterized protein n=1 Tax=Coprinellus micaceus TaxID=71717 RepID=A0A4Y7S7X8_COPMI|nr:hypothetical protein FA13DRAFT_1720648 [Coprinellus micaceus]
MTVVRMFERERETPCQMQSRLRHDVDKSGPNFRALFTPYQFLLLTGGLSIQWRVTSSHQLSRSLEERVSPQSLRISAVLRCAGGTVRMAGGQHILLDSRRIAGVTEPPASATNPNQTRQRWGWNRPELVQALRERIAIGISSTQYSDRCRLAAKAEARDTS